jgi:hypothetical protein
MYEAPPENDEAEIIVTSGPVVPPRDPAVPPRDKPRSRPPMREPMQSPQSLSPSPAPQGNATSPLLPKRPRRSDYEGMDLSKPPKERIRSLPVSPEWSGQAAMLVSPHKCNEPTV